MNVRTETTRQNGFVIVVVLCMVICMTALLLGFNYVARVNLHTLGTFRRSEQAVNCARAGLNIAIAAVRDSNSVATGNGCPGPLSGESVFPVGDGDCSVSITPENSKLNVNLLKDKNGKLDRARIDQMLRLIDLLNKQDSDHEPIGYGMVPAIIDWVDSDDQVTCLPFVSRQNLGAESDYYNNLDAPYSCRDGPLATVEELLLVKAVTPELFSGIRDYITVRGNGKVNINFASKPVIESLSEKMDPILAQMIIDRRDIKPFDAITELREVPGITDEIYTTVREMVTVDSSEYYHVIAKGTAGGLSRTIVAIVQKNMAMKNVDVVSYQEL
jgi:general secretion pathway protein K